MRTPVLLAVLALLAVPLPLAAADHVGPCWHEYVEAALDAATRPPKEALQVIGRTIDGCTDAPILCQVLDPCVLP